MLYGEAEIQDTIAAIEAEKSPAVSVSLDQLKSVRLGERELSTRYSRIPEDDADTYLKSAQLTPALPMLSPYDQWRTWHEKPSYHAGDAILPKQNVYEERYVALGLPDWLPYITTTFLQQEPGLFLEYLRLIKSTRNNPWVEPVFHGDNASNRFAYADIMTGEEHSASRAYPPMVMYPHTVTADAQLDMSITLDRFIETLIYDSLGQSFTVLDIARTTDPQFLEWAYKKVLNRAPYVKSQISESSVVRIIKDGTIFKTVSVSINPELQTMLKQAADDALILIRQNVDKLAERVIEVKSLQAQGITAQFVGPVFLNPLTPATMTQEEINRKMNLKPVGSITPAYNLPASLMPVYYPQPPVEDAAGNTDAAQTKKTNYLLPIAGAAAAALGIYAMTR